MCLVLLPPGKQKLHEGGLGLSWSALYPCLLYSRGSTNALNSEYPVITDYGLKRLLSNLYYSHLSGCYFHSLLYSRCFASYMVCIVANLNIRDDLGEPPCTATVHIYKMTQGITPLLFHLEIQITSSNLLDLSFSPYVQHLGVN